MVYFYAASMFISFKKLFVFAGNKLHVQESKLKKSHKTSFIVINLVGLLRPYRVEKNPLAISDGDFRLGAVVPDRSVCV